MDIAAVDGSSELASITEKLLAQLPAWFGIPEANAEYATSAHKLNRLATQQPARSTEPQVSSPSKS